MFDILCAGPGPHNPPSGVIGQSSAPSVITALRCTSDACQADGRAAQAAAQLADQNGATIRTQITAALAANRQDQTQDQNVITQAAAIPSGTLSTAQLSNLVRQLGQAVSVLAQNDVNGKKQLNAIVRLILAQLDDTN